jgi:hypothetical protein
MADWVRDTIQGFCDGPGNTLQDPDNERAWAAPMVGFAKGDDDVWELFKDVVGPYHWTPQEAFALAFPDADVAPAELAVIAWVLPQTEATKVDQRQRTEFPAERWARSRIYGEQFNDRLRQHVVGALRARGVDAVAPFLLPQWESRDSVEYTIASTWSERHAAYAAGLGTFGLCDGLITPRGKAMRVGSVVARMTLTATPRPYTGRGDYCLFYAQGTCGECIDRCPVGAISESGHDKRACQAHLRRTAAYVRRTYGFEGYGCGLCQTGVPCESGVPAGLRAPTG